MEPTEFDKKTAYTQIRRELSEKQKWSLWGNIPIMTIKKAIADIEKHPYGRITVRGISFPLSKRKVTIIYVKWYTLHGKKWYSFTVSWMYPEDAPVERYTASFNKVLALSSIFPERYMKYREAKIRHKIRMSHVVVPNDRFNRLYDSKYGMLLIGSFYYTDGGMVHDARYLCSPAGYMEVLDNPISVYDAARRCGIDIRSAVPSLVDDASWESIEPYWVMAALRR